MPYCVKEVIKGDCTTHASYSECSAHHTLRRFQYCVKEVTTLTERAVPAVPAVHADAGAVTALAVLLTPRVAPPHIAPLPLPPLGALAPLGAARAVQA